jgi:hypothetical protein
MKCYIVFKENVDKNVSYVAVDDNNIASAIDQLCLSDDEYIIIKGSVIKDTNESRQNILPNLLRKM